MGRTRKRELGVFERQARAIQARKPIAEQKAKSKEAQAPSSSDIEVCLEDYADGKPAEVTSKRPDTEKQQAAKNVNQASKPRKSPKKEEQQSARNSDEASAAPQERERNRKTPSRASKKVEKKLSFDEEQPSSTDAMAPKEAERPAAAPEPLDEPLPVLEPEAVKLGCSWAWPAILNRASDRAGGPADEMPLRPQLLEVQRELEKALCATVDHRGQNKSMLLLGPPGVGKTLERDVKVVERAAKVLQSKYNVDAADPRVGFVRLNGLLHAEERIAFREIARQLCKIFGMEFIKTASAFANQGFLREMLEETYKSERAVVFLLDKWELFAKGARQTLLYNLLDACMGHQMQAAVVGVSCRRNADTMLEKRIQSRFACSRLLVSNLTGVEFESAPNAPPAVLRAMLTLPPAAASDAAARSFTACFNAAVRKAVGNSDVTKALWLLFQEGLGVPKQLNQIAHSMSNFCAMDQCLPQAQHLLSAIQLTHGWMDAAVKTVSYLCVLELFILVALDRLRRKGKETLNFEMAYDEYCSLRRGGAFRGFSQISPRMAAYRAYEYLLATSLVTYTNGRRDTKSGLKHYAPVTLMVSRAEIQSGLKHNQQAPSVLSDWLNSEVTAPRKVA